MTVVIVFKNGYELNVKCEEVKMSRNTFSGRVTDISFKGITENKPMDIDFDEIQCIYRVFSDEKAGADNETDNQ